jgi:hypothetical protein
LICFWFHAVDFFRSQEPICSYECTEEDESESSDDDDDDDAEAQNAFEKFISQNKLSMSRSLSNDDKSLEADMEEQENNSAGTKCIICSYYASSLIMIIYLDKIT